jgi:glycosyltransferase involved in cell wall biosynthesis
VSEAKLIPSLGYRLLIDIQGVQGPFNDRGVARTVAELSMALIRIGAPVAGLLLNPNLPAPPSWFPELCGHPLLVWATAENIRRLQAGGPTVCFVPSPMEGSEPVDGVWPPFLSHTPFVPLIHDAIPYEDPVAYDIRHADRRLHTTRPLWLEAASHVLATTTFAAEQWQRLVDPLPEGISVIGMGVSDFYRPSPDRAATFAELQADLPGITKPFVLYVGGDDERKNVDGAIRAWAAMAPDVRANYQFVIACSAQPDVRAKWESLAAQAGLQPGELVVTGFVSEATLRSLYQTAELHFFASLSEGFGMPIVEAIACGCPVISSNTTSMPEVVGWEPGLFDPTDTDAMSSLVTKALTDDAYRTELQAACQASLGQHSWDAAAHRIVHALAANVPVPQLRTGPKRLAVIGPIAASETTHTTIVALLDELRAANPGLEIDFFDDRTTPIDAAHYPLGAYGRTLSPGGYDERLYVLPNTPGNDAIYKAARSHPGTVWLMDGSLSTLLPTLLGSTKMHAHLARWYGDRTPSAIRHADVATPEVLASHHLLATAEIAALSQRVLVPDAVAATNVRVDLGPWRKVIVDVASADAFPRLRQS